MPDFRHITPVRPLGQDHEKENHMTTRRWTALAVAAGAMLLASCASGTSDDAAGGGSTTDDKVIADAKALTEQNFAGTDRELPADGPKAAPNKTVWAIACSTTAPGCALPAEGLVSAGKVMGWNMKLIDGKLDPAVYNSQIRAAAAANADAVVLFSVDCAATEGAIKSAQEQGTKVFAANALDCDDKFAGGGKPLFDGDMVWGADGEDYPTYIDKHVGPSIASWVIAETEGKANVIQLRQDDSAGTRHIGESEFDTLKTCGGCTVNTVPFTGADLLGGKVQTKLSAALQKFPNADVVMVPTDATIFLGAGAAVDQARASGRKLLLVGHEGVPGAIALIKKGNQSFALGRPWPWTGWAAADALNRMFAGEKPVDPGFGFGSMDADHLPKGDVYDGNEKSAGYQDNYKRIWGVA